MVLISLEFDLAVCIRFDRATFGIEWARELTRDEFAAIATPYGLKWRASSGRVAASGADVTAGFRDAWALLASSPA